MVSIVITYHNEGQAFLEECVRQVHDTCRLSSYEIIVVDDCSDVPLSPLPATVIRNQTNLGTGQSFDKGIRAAVGETIIMMGCDMRFIDNAWALKMLQDVKDHPDAIVCTRCLSLKRDRLSFDEARKKPSGYGCDLLLSYKEDALCAQWAPKLKSTTYRIPVVMGACYAFRKAWFDYIEGWNLYRGKGALEAFLSVKSWFFGGECIIDRTIETGHIYRDKDEHSRKLSDEIYNKLLLDYWFFDKEMEENIALSKAFMEAKKIFYDNLMEIRRKKKEYAAKIVVSKSDYLKRYISVKTLNRP